MTIFPIRLKELRKEQNLSQKELARRLETTNSSICDWERGRSQPSLEKLSALADCFCVTTDYLLGRKDF